MRTRNPVVVASASTSSSGCSSAVLASRVITLVQHGAVVHITTVPPCRGVFRRPFMVVVAAASRLRRRFVVTHNSQVLHLFLLFLLISHFSLN